MTWSLVELWTFAGDPDRVLLDRAEDGVIDGIENRVGNRIFLF